MLYYAFVREIDSKIVGKGLGTMDNEGIFNAVITKSVYDDLKRYMAVPRVVEGETIYDIILNPNYDAQQAAIRELEFRKDFFYIPTFGWYRKKPKGYSSAIESLNTVFNAVSLIGTLAAGILIFYQAPDFTKPEECTEEWLVQHQSFNSEMTAQQFGQFYVAFVTAWNTQEHETINS